MRAVFMGTPAFAVPCLRAMAENGYMPEAVFTQPDRPKGRGYKLTRSPVKEQALALGIPVFQPESLRKGDDAAEALGTLTDIAPDIIVVTAYGQILPKEILGLPKYGCVNIHASLLPKYRGAAPINKCLADGEKITGVTSMMMDEGLDTGDMLIKRETEIGRDETYEQLYGRLSELGAQVLVETLGAIENGTAVREKQDESLATYCTVITKEMSRLDFSQSAEKLHNIIRGLTGFTFLGGKRFKIFASVLEDATDTDAADGEIVGDGRLTVKCGDGGLLTFTEVQLEGSRRMSAEEFLRGRKTAKGTILG